MDTPQHVDNLFVFEAGSKNTIIKDNHGTIITDGYAERCKQPKQLVDENIITAIADLYDEVDEKGNRIFTDKAQWYAVYRVLSEYFSYPKKMTDFVNTVKEKELEVREPNCAYTSIVKVPNVCTKLTAKPDTWTLFEKIDDAHKKQCVVAQFLLKKLGLTD